jgi:triacylglycerol esterase/lipase EstA (alpha/beta hydrolase family)
VLVGHSFGGLVIKSMIAEADWRVMRREAVQSADATELTKIMDSQCREFLKHIRHIIFYAVPHLGADYAKYAKLLDKIVNLRLAGIVDNMEPFQKEMKDLSDNFQLAICRKSRIPIYAFAETPTSMMVKSLPKQQ